MGLIKETEVERVGWGERLGLWVEHGVESDDVRGEVFGDKGVADGIVVDATLGIKDIEGDSVAGNAVERESCVDKDVVIGPQRAVGVDPRGGEVIVERQRQWGSLACFGGRGDVMVESGEEFLGGGKGRGKAEEQYPCSIFKNRLHSSLRSLL